MSTQTLIVANLGRGTGLRVAANLARRHPAVILGCEVGRKRIGALTRTMSVAHAKSGNRGQRDCGIFTREIITADRNRSIPLSPGVRGRDGGADAWLMTAPPRHARRVVLASGVVLWSVHLPAALPKSRDEVQADWETAFATFAARLRVDVAMHRAHPDRRPGVAFGGDLNTQRPENRARVEALVDELKLERARSGVMYLASTRGLITGARQIDIGSDHKAITARLHTPDRPPVDGPHPTEEEPVSTVRQRGTDSSGRPIYASDALWEWWTGYVLTHPRVKPFADRVTITQGSWMSKTGGGASASAGYHDYGGAFDLRVWNLTADEQAALIWVIRSGGAPAWLRDMQHGGFSDAHIHLAAGWDLPVDSGIAAQVAAYVAGRDGLASNGPDYHPRPSPLVTTRPTLPTPVPEEDDDMALSKDGATEVRKIVADEVTKALKPLGDIQRALNADLTPNKDDGANTVRNALRTLDQRLTDIEAKLDQAISGNGGAR